MASNVAEIMLVVQVQRWYLCTDFVVALDIYST